MPEKTSLDHKYNPHRIRPKPGTKVKKFIAVVSGKGGVGKSTVSALLASHAQKSGLKTGVIDGDILGPSMGQYFNIHEGATGNQDGVFPAVSKHGVKVMTSNMLIQNETTPILWRGSLVSKAVEDFYGDVLWGELDLMVLDMPPGTGDIALSVFQTLPIDGIIIVTSPQDLVTMIVSKAVEMANKMNIPILGIIENFSSYTCDECQKVHYPFGQSKVTNVASNYQLPLLAQLPIVPQYNQLADEGRIEDIESDEFYKLIKLING